MNHGHEGHEGRDGPRAGTGTARRPMGAERQTLPRGRVHVIPERCKECRYCVEFCPEQVLAFSPDVNAKGYHYPIMAAGHEDDCVDCGFCTLICPELAIFTRPE